MSQYESAIKFMDGAIWWYQYDGVRDKAISHIYSTFEQLQEKWGEHKVIECSCELSEKCHIRTPHQTYYRGVACRNCGSLVLKERPEFAVMENFWENIKLLDGGGNRLLNVQTIDPIRFKTAAFATRYGASATTLAKTLGLSVKEAEEMSKRLAKSFAPTMAAMRTVFASSETITFTKNKT